MDNETELLTTVSSWKCEKRDEDKPRARVSNDFCFNVKFLYGSPLNINMICWPTFESSVRFQSYDIRNPKKFWYAMMITLTQKTAPLEGHIWIDFLLKKKTNLNATVSMKKISLDFLIILRRRWKKWPLIKSGPLLATLDTSPGIIVISEGKLLCR